MNPRLTILHRAVYTLNEVSRGETMCPPPLAVKLPLAGFTGLLSRDAVLARYMLSSCVCVHVTRGVTPVYCISKQLHGSTGFLHMHLSIDLFYAVFYRDIGVSRKK